MTTATATAAGAYSPADTPHARKRLALTIVAVAVGALSVFVYVSFGAERSPVGTGLIAAAVAVAVYLWRSGEPRIAAKREELLVAERERRAVARGKTVILIDPARRGRAVNAYAKATRCAEVLMGVPLALLGVPLLAGVIVNGWLIITTGDVPLRRGTLPPDSAVMTYLNCLTVMLCATGAGVALSAIASVPLGRRGVYTTALTAAELASYPAATAEAITTAVDHMHRTCSPRNQACSDRTRTRWERIAAHPELAPAHQQCWDLILAARAEDETSRAHQSACGSNSDQRGTSHG
ncbi:hypothetical protein AB4Z55_00300 [Gordonia sp. ABKF26]|uniref:hypothetical protein n=1 Tax=Gordonia sp. ABKF26 TaxID=3238687 RepID=UPI0034E4412C